MDNEELKRAIEENKEKISKMSEEELEKASAGINLVGPYQEACESYVPSFVIQGNTPKQCGYCGFATPAYNGTSKYFCIKDLIK